MEVHHQQLSFSGFQPRLAQRFHELVTADEKVLAYPLTTLAA